jgi:transcription antitermination factor NusG
MMAAQMNQPKPINFNVRTPAAEFPAPQDEPGWYVMLTEPQQDLTTVWRLHELGLELFVPVVRKRVKTGRIGKNGHKVTRIIAKPMFPGYGFLRVGSSLTSALGTRGIRDFMRTATGFPVTLPHAAALAVFRKQMEEQYKFLRRSQFKPGDAVQIDRDGGAWSGMVATVDKIDSKGRIEVLLGMIRHTLPADMVVAL